MLKLIAAALLLSAPAWANPPTNALFGQIGADQVAIYMAPGQIENCFYFEQLKPGQSWFAFSGPLCNITQATIDQYGGAAGLITAYLPQINAIFATQYGGGGGGTPSDQINTALRTAFKFTGLGSPAVAPK